MPCCLEPGPVVSRLLVCACSARPACHIRHSGPSHTCSDVYEATPRQHAHVTSCASAGPALPVPGAVSSRSRKLDQLAIDAIDRGPHSLQQLGGVHLGYTMLNHASSPRRGRAAAAGWRLGSGAASAARRSAVRSCPELSELSDPAVRSKPLSGALGVSQT